MGPTNKVFKFGVEVCQWVRDGKVSYSIRKSYKDKDGNYKDTNTFFDKDIINLRDALNEIIQECDIQGYEPKVNPKEYEDIPKGIDDDIPW